VGGSSYFANPNCFARLYKKLEPPLVDLLSHTREDQLLELVFWISVKEYTSSSEILGRTPHRPHLEPGKSKMLVINYAPSSEYSDPLDASVGRILDPCPEGRMIELLEEDKSCLESSNARSA
jgi:hypothetical protein